MTSHLEREIAEQPEVIARLLALETANARRIGQAIREFNPAFVSIAARGTSDNAGRYAQYLFGIQARLPVALATPSIHTLYDSPPNLSRALVIGISQSGQSEDVRQVIADAREQGALTLSITNSESSPLDEAAEYRLALHAGEEISVAATKTYTAQLTAIAMLVTALTDSGEMQAELDKLPAYADETHKLSEPISAWIERYRYMERFVVLGRGYNYCTTFEISLKIKELCYIIGEEYSEADFRHGPIAVIQPGFPALVVAPKGETLLTMMDLLKQLNERRAECIVISNDEVASTYGQKTVFLPKVMPEWLSPVAAVIPGQVFALRLAEVKGHVVDQPRGLTKVTVTR
jgi:glucosamine--fructose-6-phosphate aminotransferase (isomerizing)